MLRPRVPAEAEPIACALPGLRALRWSTDAPHVGVKDAFTSARVSHGRTLYWSHGATWPIAPGSLLVQRAGDVCRLEHAPRTHCQVLTLDATLLSDAPTNALTQPHLPANDPRGAALHALHNAVARGDDALSLQVAVVEALASLRALGDPGPRCTAAVRRATLLLRERYAEALSLDEIAEYAGADKYRLCRAFRAEIGLAPHAYLVRLRVNRAKELLRAGRRASEVATQVGFYDQSQLNRHFRRVVGVTPAKWELSARG